LKKNSIVNFTTIPLEIFILCDKHRIFSSTPIFYIFSCKLPRFNNCKEMSITMQTTMPDIADTAPALQTGKLDWVGMGEIELPFIFESHKVHVVSYFLFFVSHFVSFHQTYRNNLE